MTLMNEMRRRKQKFGVVIRRTADAWVRGKGRRACLPSDAFDLLN